MLLLKSPPNCSHSLPISQLIPSKPAAHVHVYESIPSTQVASFWHGLLEHSSGENNNNNKMVHFKGAKVLAHPLHVVQESH